MAPDLPVRENRAHDSLPDYEILGLAALATFGLAFVRNAKSITDGRGDIDADMIVAGALLKPSLDQYMIWKQFRIAEREYGISDSQISEPLAILLQAAKF